MPDTDNNTKLEVVIDRLLDALLQMDPVTPGFAKITDQIVKLHKMKEEEKNPPPTRVSKDTLALIAANLVGIVLIITHERVNVITTKAMTMLPKPR